VHVYDQVACERSVIELLGGRGVGWGLGWKGSVRMDTRAIKGRGGSLSSACGLCVYRSVCGFVFVIHCNPSLAASTKTSH
jgi:hypothetical protein